MSNKVKFEGTITAVKARIRLIRSFDEISHAYLGYTLVMDAFFEEKQWNDLRVAIGQKTHEKNRFRIGDYVSGEAVPIKNPKQEWADLYKVSALKIISRGSSSEDRPADMKGGIAPPLNVYREQGHLRLDPRTYESKCKQCPWGIVMATEIIIDHWNPDKKKWRYEIHCYGPRDCPHYRPGKARTVQGRKPGMVWVNDDVEREHDNW
ncbi:MAG: hypothetical protein OEZ31_11240 [Nitrospirota bacterium]|nr:hypothetical protein [Nitrospirota bacterium]